GVRSRRRPLRRAVRVSPGPNLWAGEVQRVAGVPLRRSRCAAVRAMVRVVNQAARGSVPNGVGCGNSVGVVGAGLASRAVASALPSLEAPLLAWSLYFVTCRLLAFLVLLARGDRSKELEILVLRHELAILRRQAGRPRFEPHDRLVLAALSRLAPRRPWAAFPVRPETLLRWHRLLVARRGTLPHRRPGRARIDGEVRGLILRLARENTSWATSGSSASCASSRSTFRQRWCGACSPTPAFRQRRNGTERAGAASCTSRASRCSPAISSPSTRSGCGACTCSSSSRSEAAGSRISPARPTRIRPRCSSTHATF